MCFTLTGNGRGESAGSETSPVQADCESVSNSETMASSRENSESSNSWWPPSPAHPKSRKGQVSLEYYLLLLAVSTLFIIAIAWAGGFAASQKDIYANVSRLVENTTNSTLGGLGGSGPLLPGPTNSSPKLALEIYTYEPYWTGQPAIFTTRIWNRGGGIGTVDRLSISVRNPEGKTIAVGPSLFTNISVPFSYSATSQFAPNSTGTHTIRAIAYTKDGQFEISKEVLVLGGG